MTSHPANTHERYAASAAESYERHFVPVIGLPFARRLVGAAQLAPGERVLDVACGTGVATRLAAEAVGPDGAVAGLDVNPWRGPRCRRRRLRPRSRRGVEGCTARS